MDFADVAITYQAIPLAIHNTGRTVQVRVAAGSVLHLDGEAFELQQFHFHHPSEHMVAGMTYPMEIHWVHGNPHGQYAVVSTFLTAGVENAWLRSLWADMPAPNTLATTISGMAIDMAQILPRDGAIFRYDGSLTTPPCSETVKWIVFQTPIEVSSDQVARFAARFPFNARPVQPRNRRPILQSG